MFESPFVDVHALYPHSPTLLAFLTGMSLLGILLLCDAAEQFFQRARRGVGPGGGHGTQTDGSVMVAAVEWGQGSLRLRFPFGALVGMAVSSFLFLTRNCSANATRSEWGDPRRGPYARDECWHNEETVGGDR